MPFSQILTVSDFTWWLANHFILNNKILLEEEGINSIISLQSPKSTLAFDAHRDHRAEMFVVVVVVVK